MKCGNAGCRRTADRLVYLATVTEVAYAACPGCVRYLGPEELPANVAVVRVVFMGDVEQEGLALTLEIMDDIELATEWTPGLRLHVKKDVSDPESSN